MKLVFFMIFFLAALFLLYYSAFANSIVLQPDAITFTDTTESVEPWNPDLLYMTARLMISGNYSYIRLSGNLSKLIATASSLTNWVVMVILLGELRRYVAQNDEEQDSYKDT